MEPYEYEHILVDGIYLRKMKIKAGTAVLGVVHRKETALVVLKGSLRIAHAGKIRIAKAGEIIISTPGTQRSVLTLEDTELFTMHSVSSSSLPEIEAELSECTELLRKGKFKAYRLGVLHESFQLGSRDTASLPAAQHLLPLRAASISERYPALHDATV